MSAHIVLASASTIRRTLLQNAGLTVEVSAARIDEETITASLLAEGAKPRDIADALSEYKAEKVNRRYPEALVIGADQVLEFDGALLSKPETPGEAEAQLRAMSGKTHRLLSAAVIYHEGKPAWRHVGQARLTMRTLGDTYVSDYVARNWTSIRHSVGSYKLEEEGVRLFHRVEGDYFTVLGLPLLELLSYLTLRGEIDG
jgi:septum formation protein